MHIFHIPPFKRLNLQGGILYKAFLFFENRRMNPGTGIKLWRRINFLIKYTYYENSL
jgi:hypothetical protein